MRFQTYIEGSRPEQERQPSGGVLYAERQHLLLQQFQKRAEITTRTQPSRRIARRRRRRGKRKRKGEAKQQLQIESQETPHFHQTKSALPSPAAQSGNEALPARSHLVPLVVQQRHVLTRRFGAFRLQAGVCYSFSNKRDSAFHGTLRVEAYRLHMAMQGTTLDSQPKLMTSVAQVKPYRRLDSAGKAIQCSIPNARSHSPPPSPTPETPGAVRGGIVVILFFGPCAWNFLVCHWGKRKGDQGPVGVTSPAGFLFGPCFIGYRECWGCWGASWSRGRASSGCIVRM